MLPSERLRQERTLRDAVLAGDRLAWRALYDGAASALWAYVLWRCAGLRDCAEEITQETWLIAVRRLGDFDPAKGAFLAWLRGIAVRVLRNQLRVRQRHESALDQDVAEPTRDGDQAELIALALAELPEHYEAVLRAKYADHQSVEQIALEMGMTAKAVESLLTRARHSFRTAYEKRTGATEPIRETQP